MLAPPVRRSALAASLLFPARTIVSVALAIACVTSSLPAADVAAKPDELAGWLTHLQKKLPTQPQDFTEASNAEVAKSAAAIEQWASQIAAMDDVESPAQVLAVASRLLEAKDRADELLQKAFALRVTFVTLDSKKQRPTIVAYLRTTAKLIDLTGRLRYTLFDVITDASYATLDNPKLRKELVDLLVAHRSSIGAAVMVPYLSDEFVAAEQAAPLDEPTKQKLLQLAGKAAQSELLPTLAEFLQQPDTAAQLKLEAALAIREIGLPQDPRPDQDPTLPTPAITARQLHTILSAINATSLSEAQASQHQELLSWLTQRAEQGIVGDTYRFAGNDVRPGDWLLMRNPSPYNLFTDLSPGLFTHVGVVTAETASDGIRRIVIVDMPEKGNRMPATNVDVFVQRTLHFVFMRHDDPAVTQKMAEVATSTIGEQTEFDLNFRTERLADLKGRSLAGKIIHTYCAGLLLLCAQETTAPREEFFPIAEFPAGGRSVENLAKIGITFGDHFVSPTGAFFSPQLQLVAQREPMYDPRREVEEAIFDHFARNVATKTLTPSLDWLQSLRSKVASAAEFNPQLAAALARAVDAPKQTDLASAARAAAIIETLDEIAFSNSAEFLLARRAMTAGPADELQAQGLNQDDIAKIVEQQKKHASLLERWNDGSLNPRTLRIQLVKYYVQRGQKQLDERFFATGPTTTRQRTP